MDRNLHLPMETVADQRQHHAAIMSAQTELDRGGVAKTARTLFDRIIARLEQALNTDRLMHAVELFKEQTLVSAAQDRLGAVEELTQPRLDLGEIGNRLFTLRDVAAGVAGTATRAVDDTLKACLHDAATRLRAEMSHVWQTSPDGSGEVLQQARRTLDGFTIQPMRPQPFNRLKKLFTDSSNLDTIHPGPPRRCRSRITGALYLRMQKLFGDALAEQVRHLLPRFFNEKRDEMREVLREWIERSSAYRTLIDEVRSQLDELITQAESRSANRSSATVLLPGANEVEIIAGMREKFAVPDVAGVAERLHAEFNDALRKHLAQTTAGLTADTDEPLPALLMLLPATKIAELWSRVVESNLGRGQGLYERLAQVGTKKFAGQLYDRAEHTISLGGRNIGQLNVNTTELAIVSLPVATRPQDTGIRKSLEAEFRKIDRGIDIQTLPAGHPEIITLLRIEHGFPVGILIDNYALVQAYGEAAPAKHPPHVITLSSQPDANALPAYLDLDRRLRHQVPPGENE